MSSSNKLIISALLIASFSSVILCAFPTAVNSQITDFTTELTQPQLLSGHIEALLWGQGKDRFKQCVSEAKYYDIIQNNWTMTKNFNNQRSITTPHDGLIVNFSYIFTNFDASFVNGLAYSTIYFDDQNSRAFSSVIQSGNQGCGFGGNDGRGQLTVFIPHTSQNLKVFIDAALNGADQKLGIRDLSIKTVKCSGTNYYFSEFDGNCYCKLGYKMVKQVVNGVEQNLCQAV